MAVRTPAVSSALAAVEEVVLAVVEQAGRCIADLRTVTRTRYLAGLAAACKVHADDKITLCLWVLFFIVVGLMSEVASLTASWAPRMKWLRAGKDSLRSQDHHPLLM